MRTLTIEILNDKAMKLIKDLELMKLIHVRKERDSEEGAINWAAKYKGAMQKQPLIEVDNQINDLHISWE